jgi:hypothetical protein
MTAECVAYPAVTRFALLKPAVALRMLRTLLVIGRRPNKKAAE